MSAVINATMSALFMMKIAASTFIGGGTDIAEAVSIVRKKSPYFLSLSHLPKTSSYEALS
jgi:hypothetical protein